jgi:hypothetical protein
VSEKAEVLDKVSDKAEAIAKVSKKSKFAQKKQDTTKTDLEPQLLILNQINASVTYRWTFSLLQIFQKHSSGFT